MSIFDTIHAKVAAMREEGREVLLTTEELLKHLAAEVDTLASKVGGTSPSPAAADPIPITPASAPTTPDNPPAAP